jgi:hypothetical protein
MSPFARGGLHPNDSLDAMRADFMNDYNKVMQGTELDLLGSNMKAGSNEKLP